MGKNEAGFLYPSDCKGLAGPEWIAHDVRVTDAFLVMRDRIVTISMKNVCVAPDSVRSFCERWRIARLSLFGSVLRDDFHPASDIDVLVVFDPEVNWSLWYDWPVMLDELKILFGREVDLVEEHTIVNPFRRKRIFSSRLVLHDQ